MASLRFEGRRVPFQEGDTIASALHRAGVRTFTRSIKHHRRRGLFCLSGDCPNCLVNVDGDPGVRACLREASDGQRVRRESGFPGAERDLLAIANKLHPLMPVGFYYKAFGRPRWLWPLAERVIRRATGIGALRLDEPPRPKPAAHVHADVMVLGGGVAGLAAARSAAAGGGRVLLVDEGLLGEKIPPGPVLEEIRGLAGELRAMANVRVLERHAAIGVYEGPLVPVVGPREMLEVEADRIVVATGAVETHAVFRGNDLPGVWLGRGAARMAGAHGVAPGRRAVVMAGTAEGLEHLATLRGAGVGIAEVVVPSSLADRVPAGLPVARDGRLVAAVGKRQVTGVVFATRLGERRVACDTLVLSLGLEPRDGLLRVGEGLPVIGAGDVVAPGCTLDEALESGARAGAGERLDPVEPEPAPPGESGYVCLCEDVSVKDLRQAWDEGWTNAEILKRYTAATMGPCQGAVCGRHLAAFVRSKSVGEGPAGARAG
ncbi:MAG: (2Fe-2S)-binding protein [Actinobacteria bacterium]|nr:(2Fe-2S)-binding protein [Actinomycetota bacterium]